MMFEGVENRSFIPMEYVIRLARTPWERAGYHTLRREVFCTEQGVFSGHDRDAIDETAIPIIAACCVAGMPDRVVGAVRIHEPSRGYGAAPVWRFMPNTANSGALERN